MTSIYFAITFLSTALPLRLGKRISVFSTFFIEKGLISGGEVEGGVFALKHDIEAECVARFFVGATKLT